MLKKCMLGLLLGTGLLGNPAQADMTIDITGGASSRIPVAVSPFGGTLPAAQTIPQVVGADLLRSGELSLINISDLNPVMTDPKDPRFGLARSRGADAVVLGSVQPVNGQMSVAFRLMDAVRQTQLAGYSYTADPAQSRMIAHKIADVVYQTLTGTPGVFSSHIVYVLHRGGNYLLQVADSDGHNPQTVLKSRNVIMSPAWSLDGKKMAYVSFEKGHAVIYEQMMDTGRRIVLANYPGSNSAPAWSPDGKRLAVVLTKDGSSQIYLINADGSGLTRLTFSGAIDTEPNWSPDGTQLLFTSDRDGSPQVYSMPVAGGKAQRMTFDGKYNVSARWSPDGKKFVFVQRMSGQYRIAVMELASGQLQVLTDGTDDESPSYAANGKMILYSATVAGRSDLAVVTSDGNTHERLINLEGEMDSPVWGR